MTIVKNNLNEKECRHNWQYKFIEGNDWVFFFAGKREFLWTQKRMGEGGNFEKKELVENIITMRR